jgi:hypothetical protein
MLNEPNFELEKVSRLDYSSLQLSLYFFLLIFFVLLNYVNPYVEVVGEVKKNEFSIPKNLLIVNEANQQIISQVSNYYQNKLLSITPPGYSTVKDYLELILQIKTDSALFFQNNSAILGVGEKLFLTNLAQILNLSVQNYTLNITIELGVKEMNVQNPEFALHFNRINTIAAYLVDNEVAPEKISTKISTHAHNILVLSFELAK